MCQPPAEPHGLSGCGGLVQQGGIGYGQACQLCYHGLVVHEALQPALPHLRLVGRVLGDPEGRWECIASATDTAPAHHTHTCTHTPSRVLQHVLLNDARNDAVGVAHANVGAEQLVLLRNVLYSEAHLQLG